jgi:signal peptidase I
MGRKGLTYLLFHISAYVLSYIAAHLEMLSLGAESTKDLLIAAIWLVGVTHCYFVSKRMHDKTPMAWFARWYNIIGVFLVAPVFAAFVVRVFFLEPFNIPSSNMLPTLRIGDHLMVSKLAYGYSRYSLPWGLPLIEERILESEPERGDVVVFKLPKDNETDYINRIIGLPGDTIQVLGGVLHINGKPVSRREVGTVRWTSYGGNSRQATEYIETLPNGREHRIWELSDGDFLDNTPVYDVPPGHYFMMGDNRDSSQDSRVLSAVGFVPFRNLVGRLSIIFWNSREQKLMWSVRDKENSSL